MLKICKNMFETLNKSKVPYCVYKGMAHLDDDLKGERGDIDILVPYKSFDRTITILKNEGFFHDINTSIPSYLFALDIHTHNNIMLDLVCSIYLGDKPYTPYQIKVDFSKLKTIEHLGIIILHQDDYIPLIILSRLASTRSKFEDLIEIQSLLKKYGLSVSYLSEMLVAKLGVKAVEIQTDFLLAPSWDFLHKKYRKQLINQLDIRYFHYIKQLFNKPLRRIHAIRRRIFCSPRYRIRRKGFMVAFVGVDGAGKSSAVEYVQNLPFFKRTGMRMIYFGNNHYIMPGLTKLVAKKNKSKLLGFLVSVLSRVDRYTRVLKAVYFIGRGNIVLADRYFYDDKISLALRGAIKPKKGLRKLASFLLKPRMPRRPELTIFLDVSPEIAYRRKQDYSYERMIQVNQAYKAHMLNIPDVVRINADKAQRDVHKDIVNAIYEFDRRWG